MTWAGADPGGKNQFGLALLEDDGTFETHCVSYVDQAIEGLYRKNLFGLGIDCPLWWSSGTGGGRVADQWLRKKYKIRPGTVQSVNSLQGSVLIQGHLLAVKLRHLIPDLPITEAHPKALLIALGIKDADWEKISQEFGLNGTEPFSEHERDAILGAVAARDGFSRRWQFDLSAARLPDGTERPSCEQNPSQLVFGSVHYWWPAI